MPIPKYVEERNQFWRKFSIGDRLKERKTGRIFLVGKQRSADECFIVGLNPMGKGSITWETLLREFDLDAV